jgi:hypothetical protein
MIVDTIMHRGITFTIHELADTKGWAARRDPMRPKYVAIASGYPKLLYNAHGDTQEKVEAMARAIIDHTVNLKEGVKI